MFTLLVFAFSCTKENVQPNTANSTNQVNPTKGFASKQNKNDFFFFCGELKKVDLLAGQHHVAGEVTMGNNETHIFVRVEMKNGWEMDYSHLFIGDLADLPTNKKGNPRIGHFPYHMDHSHSNGSDVYVFEIPFDQRDEDYTVAFHAEVSNGSQSETAWADGTSFGWKSWATRTGYTVQECNTQEV